MIYKIETEAGTMYASANLAEASSPIHTYFGNDPHCERTDYEGNSWAPTPYQTADARHRTAEMAELVAEYCDMGAVLSVTAID